MNHPSLKLRASCFIESQSSITKTFDCCGSHIPWSGTLFRLRRLFCMIPAVPAVSHVIDGVLVLSAFKIMVIMQFVFIPPLKRVGFLAHIYKLYNHTHRIKVIEKTRRVRINLSSKDVLVV